MFWKRNQSHAKTPQVFPLREYRGRKFYHISQFGVDNPNNPDEVEGKLLSLLGRKLRPEEHIVYSQFRSAPPEFAVELYIETLKLRESHPRGFHLRSSHAH